MAGHTGPNPNTVPETIKVSELGKEPSLTDGGAPIPPATSVQPEVPNALLAVLNNASIIEEHRTLMGAVIEKIQSAKSGMTKAYTSLLTGFEVSGEV